MNSERLVIESMYDDVCDIFEYVSTTDPSTNITKQKEVITYANQKCRLSFREIYPTKGDNIATTAQRVKLFLSPEVEVKPGSKISITHCGQTAEYSRSGLPAIFDSHQEIILEPFRGYA